MSNSDKISLKSFLETVEERLDSFTPQQLRSILMDMAMQVPSSVFGLRALRWFSAIDKSRTNLLVKT